MRGGRCCTSDSGAWRRVRRSVGALVSASVLCLLLALTPALADPPNPQCWECLKHLILQLPRDNPQRDPSYEDGLSPGSVLPALAACSLDDSELPVLQQIIGVFTDAQANGGGAGYVQTNLAQISQLSADSRAKLTDGARQDLPTTLRHLIDRNCRLLLQAHFDEGASQAWLLGMVERGQGVERYSVRRRPGPDPRG